MLPRAYENSELRSLFVDSRLRGGCSYFVKLPMGVILGENQSDPKEGRLVVMINADDLCYIYIPYLAADVRTTLQTYIVDHMITFKLTASIGVAGAQLRSIAIIPRPLLISTP